MLSRRASLATLLAALAAPRAAAAFQEVPAPLPLRHEIDKACGLILSHQQVLEEAERLLAEQGVAETERKRLLAKVSCPVCGCPVGQE